MSTDLFSTNNTVNFQNAACGVLFAQMAFSCKFHVDILQGFSFPYRLTEGFGRLQYFNLQGLKYDDPPLPGVENSMTHPIKKAENIVTHPLCAPANPPPILIDQSLSVYTTEPNTSHQIHQLSLKKRNIYHRYLFRTDILPHLYESSQRQQDQQPTKNLRRNLNLSRFYTT